MNAFILKYDTKEESEVMHGVISFYKLSFMKRNLSKGRMIYNK